MNLLEHYIEKIHSEKPLEDNPDLIEVDFTYNCHGSIERKTDIMFKEQWDIIKEKGYFMA